MIPATSKLEAEVARAKRSMRESLGRINRGELPVKGESSARNNLALRARSIGVYYLLLDDRTAVRWFGHAADQFLRSHDLYAKFAMTSHDQSHWESEPTYVINALYAALHSGQSDRVSTAAAAVDRMDPDYTQHHRDVLDRYYYVKTLADVATDGDNTLSRYDSLLEHVNDGPARTRAYFTTLADIVGGIIEDDPDATTEALRQFLTSHEDDIEGQPDLSKEYVSIPASALTTLAVRRGLSVTVDSPYVPPLVFRLHELEIDALEPLEQLLDEDG